MRPFGMPFLKSKWANNRIAAFGSGRYGEFKIRLAARDVVLVLQEATGKSHSERNLPAGTR